MKKGMKEIKEIRLTVRPSGKTELTTTREMGGAWTRGEVEAAIRGLLILLGRLAKGVDEQLEEEGRRKDRGGVNGILDNSSRRRARIAENV